MIDYKLNASGDLEISAIGDIAPTDSICQAVRIRLLWFFEEWRLSPGYGMPYFEELFVKNPNEVKIKHRVRETVMGVEGVTDVTEITLAIDHRTREAELSVTFTTDEETFREEVSINGTVRADQ